MARQTPAAVAEKPTTALTVPQGQQALAVADGFTKEDRRGKESIDSKDVVLPFLAIAQKTSPQLEPGDKFIEGLKFTDLFNSLTGEIYGQPVRFIPIALKKHAIEFNPYDEGGGIKDRDVPWDDPRCEFTDDEKPLATRFYDWVVLLVPNMEIIVLSMKSSNISVAKQFQQIIKMRSGPVFAGLYTVGTVSAKNKFGSFGKFVIKPAGAPTPEDAQFASSLYDSLQGKNIVVDHQAEPEDGGGRQPGDEPADPEM